MARRIKVTPFARFVLFLLIATPAAYIGASYIQGEDGIENVKNLIGINSDSTEKPISKTKTIELQLERANEKIEHLQEAVEEKDAQIIELQKQIEELKE